MLAAIPFPKWISPEIIPRLPIRWYGLMYVIAFAVVYGLFILQTRKRKLDIDSDSVFSFFMWGIFGLIVGARLFGTLVYDTSGEYWRRPWLIFWPFSPEDRSFIGLRGMSYHGGLVGLIAGIMIYAKIKKLDFLAWADMIAAAVPLGYTFGRLGNFFNAELYGRVTASPFGMIFPNAEPLFPAREEWVKTIADKTGVAIANMNSMVNLPRHPSQLYEALFEGIVLFLVLWFWARRKNYFKGFTVAVYLIGYGLVRFILEYFRAPDEWLGYVVNFSGKPDLPFYIYTTPLAISLGQVFCFAMILAGVACLLVFPKLKGAHDPFRPAPSAAKPETQRTKAPSAKDARKLRKKLQ